MGDLKPAIETHEMLYEVAKRHKFIPEVIYDFKLLFYTTKNDRKIRHANDCLWYPVLPARIPAADQREGHPGTSSRPARKPHPNKQPTTRKASPKPAVTRKAHHRPAGKPPPKQSASQPESHPQTKPGERREGRGGEGRGGEGEGGQNQTPILEPVGFGHFWGTSWGAG